MDMGSEQKVCKQAAPQAASTQNKVSPFYLQVLFRAQHTREYWPHWHYMVCPAASVCHHHLPHFAPSKPLHTNCSVTVQKPLHRSQPSSKNNTGGGDPTDNHIIREESSFSLSKQINSRSLQHLEPSFANSTCC